MKYENDNWAMAVWTNKNSTYYINPAYLTFVENSGYGANLIQVSASSSCYISVYDPSNGINYSDADNNYRRWKITAYNNKFPSKDMFYIYVRLEKDGTSSLIIYDTVLRGVKGGKVTITTDENGNEVSVEEEVDEKDIVYYYILIGEAGATDGASIREIHYDTGMLTSDRGRDTSSLSEMWRLDRFSTPNLIEALHDLKGFVVRGFVKLIGGLIFKKGETEKPITDVKRSTDSDKEFLEDETGELILDEEGNPVKDESYVPVSDETLPTTRYVEESTEKKFLRKDKDDTAKGKITFNKGWDTKEFISGLFGHGAKVDENGQAELESLFIRTFLEVPELRYNRVTVRMGDEINSVSAGVIESVTPDEDADGNILTSGTLVLKLEEGEVGTLQKDDIVFQIYSDLKNPQNNATETDDDGKGNRTIKGFATVMFMVTGILDPTEEGGNCSKITYSLRPIIDGGNGIHPYQFGTFAQRGNFNNEKKDRQVIIYQGLYPQPYTRYMFGVNDWEFTAKMIGMQLGYLGNLSVFGMDMTGYSAYLNNVYFTGMIRQLYIPEWIDGESAAQNGTLVYMGGDHYISKGDTTNPPLFDLTDENGNSLIFTDEDGEGNILDLNNEEYDQLAKKGKDGVGIKSNVSYYMITDTNERPLESSNEWGSSMVQPTDLKPYLWKKNVITYSNLVKNVTIECISVRGKDGTSVSIQDSFDSEDELKAAYPNGPANASDAYMVNGDLYVWTGSEWKNLGAIKGEKGDTAYVHLKYANETSSGTQVTVGGSVYTLSFTSNDGEDVGDWFGIYTDFVQADSMNIADYKWKNIKGEKGKDSTSYWLNSPVGAINFTTDGYPSPTSFVVSMKKKTGNGNVVACSDFYLATWKYDGNWQMASISSVKTSSVIIIPAASTAYKQYRVTAHTASSASESNIVCQLGIGVSFDGAQGKEGAEGIYVYDAGFFDKSRAYYYKTIDGKVRRDKIVYEIGGSFYNFLVRSRQSDDSTGLVNTPPTSAQGDTNWEVMSQYQTLIANTVFGTNANIGGFMTSAETMLSQSKSEDGVYNIYMNGKTGEFRCRNAYVKGEVYALKGVIGGFSIDGNNLTNMLAGNTASGASIYISNQEQTRFARLNGRNEDSAAEFRNDSGTAVRIQAFGGSGNFGLDVTGNQNSKAIRSVGTSIFLSRESNFERVNVSGLCFCTQEGNSFRLSKAYGNYIIGCNVDFLVITGNCTLPDASQYRGRAIWTKRRGSGVLTVVNVYLSDGSFKASKDWDDDHSRIFISDGIYWNEFYCK